MTRDITDLHLRLALIAAKVLFVAFAVVLIVLWTAERTVKVCVSDPTWCQEYSENRD